MSTSKEKYEKLLEKYKKLQEKYEKLKRKYKGSKLEIENYKLAISRTHSEKRKILILINRIWDFPKHKQKFEIISAIEEFAEVRYWHESGDILEILDKIEFKPDFILHYDIAWKYRYAPQITNLDKVNIPKGAYVMDIHYSCEKRINYFEENKIDLIFATSKHPFLKVYPQYSSKYRFLPFSVNPEVIKDWNQKKEIDFLLMGQFYYEDPDNPPERVPPKGRYSFREAVLDKMHSVEGFLFHPHPGHFPTPSEDLLVNGKYAIEINRSKMFFTCGGEFEYPVLKFFEAPGCRTLLLAEPNPDILELGFEDGVNFVACNSENIYEKAMYYMKNEGERERIANNGYLFIHKFHTNRVRAQQFMSFVEEFLQSQIQ